LAAAEQEHVFKIEDWEFCAMARGTSLTTLQGTERQSERRRHWIQKIIVQQKLETTWRCDKDVWKTKNC